MTTLHRQTVLNLHLHEGRYQFYIVTDEQTTAFSLTPNEALDLCNNLFKEIMKNENTACF